VFDAIVPDSIYEELLKTVWTIRFQP
jgi:hypothetical protein